MASLDRAVRILVAEDEAPLLRLLEMSLQANGYEVIAAADGEQALEKFAVAQPIDLVILDVMMPHRDGFEVLQEIRETSNVPAVMLTALTTSDDIVLGLSLGADDYITKPFTFREVSARIEAVLRRMSWNQQASSRGETLRVQDIVIDTQRYTVMVRDQACHVTPIEFNLLRYLMSHPGVVVSKEVLFRDVWGYEYDAATNLVEVGIRRLREKIEPDPSSPRYIATIRGVGYRFNMPEAGKAFQEP